MAKIKQKIINATYNSLLALGMFFSLYYLAFSMLNRNNDDKEPIYWTLLPSVLLGLYGMGINAYMNWDFNAEFIKQNVADEQTSLIETTEKHNSKAFQAFVLSSAIAVEFGDFNSVSLACINWFNSLLTTNIPTILTLPIASFIFINYFPSMLPKLESIAPDLVNNRLTRWWSKHPKWFKNSSVLTEAGYDCSNALAAIPATMFVSLLELNTPVTLALTAAILGISYIAMSTENLIFEGENLRQTLLAIAQSGRTDTIDEESLMQLPAVKAYATKSALCVSLGIMALMMARPFSAVLTLTNISPELRLVITGIIALSSAYCHYNVCTESALKRIDVIPSKIPLSEKVWQSLTFFRAGIKNTVSTPGAAAYLTAPEYKV